MNLHVQTPHVMPMFKYNSKVIKQRQPFAQVQLELPTTPTNTLLDVAEHHFTENEEALGVMTYNVGALNAEKLLLVAHLMQQRRIDVSVLVDTQSSPHHKQFYTHLVTSVLGPTAGYYAYDCPTNQKIGGIAMVTNSHITHCVNVFRKDQTGLGILASLEIQRLHGVIAIIGVYSPCVSQTTGSFYNSILKWCNKNNVTEDPVQHVLNMVEHRANQILSRQQTQVIVVGDMNASRDGSQGGTNPPLNSTFLHNWKYPPVEGIIHTNYSGMSPQSWIDHIMLSPGPGAEFAWVGVADDAHFAHLSSHRPYYAGINTSLAPVDVGLRREISQGRAARKKLGKAVAIRLNHKDEMQCDDYLHKAIEFKQKWLPS